MGMLTSRHDTEGVWGLGAVATTTSWADGVQAVAALIQAAAVVVAGVWAYLRFFREPTRLRTEHLEMPYSCG
jgi:hypothetical protein